MRMTFTLTPTGGTAANFLATLEALMPKYGEKTIPDNATVKVSKLPDAGERTYDGWIQFEWEVEDA